MNVLVWQWGKRGGGPRIAVEIAEAMDELPGVTGLLSLSDRAEVLAAPNPPACALAVPTYDGLAGFALRLASAPVMVPWLARKLRKLRPDLAVCAMAGPIDLLMVAALRLIRVPFALVVHDADPHPGDIHQAMVRLQRIVARRAALLVTMSQHVAGRLRDQGIARAAGGRGPGVPVAVIRHPPRHFGPVPPPPLAHGGKLRLLFFGRLLPYKGLDLLGEALAALGPRGDMETRIVGSGPEDPALDALRALPGVTVENRWVPEEEIGALIAWSDALVLPYREASQSGAAAAAVAAGRFIVATNVGGLAEQVRDHPLGRLCAPDTAELGQALSDLLASRDAPMPEAAATGPRIETWPDFAKAILDAMP
ncbi:MAG: glycosyltransferase [Proteobacteria bacterium]|nr:glycosyltransferase [Pseudomonadota bacterium]